MGWQQFVSGIREKHQQRKADKAATRAREQELQAAIEHVVEEINPQIRALGSYRKKLRPCVARTLAHCSDLVTRVPGAVDVNRKSWGRDPMVKAFFSRVDEMRGVFSRSKEVREYFDQHADAEYCYVLLSMERKERTVLGMGMQDEVLRRDVKQTSVSFTDHRVVKPSSSESELRNNLVQRAFDNLVGYALEQITELVAARHSLEEQRRLLEMQLKVARLRHKSLIPLVGDNDSESIDINALRERQEHTGQALDQARARLTTLEDYLDRITELLGDPQTHLRLAPVSLRLNQMNIKLDEQSAESGQTLELTEATLGEDLKRILLIARFPRNDMLYDSS